MRRGAGLGVAAVFLPFGLTLVGLVSGPCSLAAQVPPPERSTAILAGRLEAIQVEVNRIEQKLIQSARNQQQAQANLKYIRALIRLRKEERDLGKKRVAELEKTVKELESRKAGLTEKITGRRKYIHHFLTAIHKESLHEAAEEGAMGGLGKARPGGKLELYPIQEREKLEAPKRKVLANLVGRGLRELEMLKIDLGDADRIEARIQEEKQQLNNLFQDLDEQEGVLELNRQLQTEILRKNQSERLARLESYQKLKTAESRVQELINNFNSRKELERTTEAESGISQTMARSVFSRLKGKLSLPLRGGKILSAFGKAYDPKSRLYIFKKGIEILSSSQKSQPVRAVYGGKVAFSGELPNYGQVTIVDHGDHFYSLCARLGTLIKKAGEEVATGEALGLTDEQGTPVYFEIRARNVAVNPLQWISN